MTIPYTIIPTKPSDSKIARPISTVRLFGPKGYWEGQALIDSGADLSLFDLRITKNIGLDLSNAKVTSLGGVGKGSLRVLIKKVEFELDGLNKKVIFEVGFIASPQVPNLLGQQGFFDNFLIKFDRTHDIIDIT